jgi:hypothetical protein
MMQSILVSWLRMRQHLPVIPLKLDGSTAVQDEQITWPQERQAPDLERTEGHQQCLMCPKKCEHQILLCLAQASRIWLFSLNNTSRLLECESLPKSWRMLIHSCSKAIQINSDCTYNMISLWGSNSLERVGDGSPGIYKGVYYIHFWFLFTNLTSCYHCVFPLTVTFSTYFQALWKLGLQFRVNCKMSRA